MKIGVTNIGGSIKFNADLLKRADGTLEYYNLIWLLLRNAAIENVYILQKNDWRRQSKERKQEIDPRGILIDAYSDSKFNVDTHDYKSLYENVKDEGIDTVIGFLSYGLTRVNIPNMIKKQKEDAYYGCLEATLNYAGNQVWMLNETEVPWFAILTDPRYIKKNSVYRDMRNLPKEFISQYNDKINVDHIKEYPHQGEKWEITKVVIDQVYTGIEKLNLTSEEIINTSGRSNLFSIASMQSSSVGSKNDYRFKELEKWIFKAGKGLISVFGRWDESYSSQYPEYFKGLLPFQELDAHFKDTKYTLIIPIGKHWATSKWCEMLRLGVIPFFHPDYDTQCNVFPKDSFLRLKDPADMWKKIETLESNPGAREKIIGDLQSKYLGDVSTGGFLFNMLNDKFRKYNLNLKIDDAMTEYKVKRNELF